MVVREAERCIIHFSESISWYASSREAPAGVGAAYAWECQSSVCQERGLDCRHDAGASDTGQLNVLTAVSFARRDLLSKYV